MQNTLGARSLVDPRMEEAEEESKLASYLGGHVATKESRLPGTDHVFVWRLVMGSQYQACVAAANRVFRRMDLDPTMRRYEDFEDEVAWQVLHVAMRDPDRPGKPSDPYPFPLAKSVEELKDKFTGDLRDSLYADYLDFESESAPGERMPNRQTIEAIDLAVKKKDATALRHFEPYMLRGYLLTTVSQLYASAESRS